MNGLASLLLLIVVVTHYGYEPIAGMYADPGHAARAIFYFLRGVEGTLLYCIIWAMTPWKPAHARLAVSVVCAWGALESAQTAICRAAIGFGSAAETKPYAGLCDVVTGWPIYMGTMFVVLIAFALNYTKKKRDREP